MKKLLLLILFVQPFVVLAQDIVYLNSTVVYPYSYSDYKGPFCGTPTPDFSFVGGVSEGVTSSTYAVKWNKLGPGHLYYVQRFNCNYGGVSSEDSIVLINVAVNVIPDPNPPPPPVYPIVCLNSETVHSFPLYNNSNCQSWRDLPIDGGVIVKYTETSVTIKWTALGTVTAKGIYHEHDCGYNAPDQDITLFDVTFTVLGNGPTLTQEPACPNEGAATIAFHSNNATDKWYTTATGGLPEYTGDTFIVPKTDTRTFYVEAVSSCVSGHRNSISRELLPDCSEVCVGWESEYQEFNLAPYYKSILSDTWSVRGGIYIPNNDWGVPKKIVTWTSPNSVGWVTRKVTAISMIDDTVHLEPVAYYVYINNEQSEKPLPPVIVSHDCNSVSLSVNSLQPLSDKVVWSNEINFSGSSQSTTFKTTSNDVFLRSVNACGYSSATFLTVDVFAIYPEYRNSVTAYSYDENGMLYSAGKTYFDVAGRKLQSQAKSFSNGTVMISEDIRDSYNRVVGSYLPLPVQKTDLDYFDNAIPSSENVPYSHLNFDQAINKYDPDPVSSTEANKLGWYYSSNNTLEPLTPSTKYPYSRTEFYDDGSDEVRKSASPGDQHYMGSGHEVVSGTFPVYNELNEYLAMRRNTLTVNLPDNIPTLNSMAEKGVQSVVRDQNEEYAINITDKEGRTVMSARVANEEDENPALVVHYSISSSGNPASLDYRPMTYFYILESQNVYVTGSNFVIEDIINNVKKPVGKTFADPHNNDKWPVGFYRVLLNDPGSSIGLYYNHRLTDVTYQFYDAAGRLKVSISPNGYKQLKNGIGYDKIDKTMYTYNYQGWLLSMTEPDAGTTRYVYRRDGKIRFSENELQRANHRFSYTNYDKLERPVESGEYRGNTFVFVPMNDPGFTGSPMHAQLELQTGVLTSGTGTQDWVKTHYDLPYSNNDISVPAQTYIRGAVSWTENANIKTIYSYDEFGRVTWMAQKPTALSRVFIVKYTYDLLGNVMKVANLSYDLSGGLLDQFYHYYEYDQDKRLDKIYTSTQDDGEKKQRAQYVYYLHGPLKRIELGDKLQGIDFVYDIHGALRSINHPDNSQDPGNDGEANGVKPDVFGMVLDYYESDLGNLFLSNATGSIHDPARRHHLPFGITDALASAHQPLIHFPSPAALDERYLETTSFKDYGAQSPAYKEMVLNSKDN